MAQTIFPISTIVTVSVSNPPVAVNEYNTSNLAIFTTESHEDSFGDLDYALYDSPTQVGIDFGTDSRTYQMANGIFSQNPNILLGGGQLIIIPMGVATQKLALSGIPASGTFKLNFGGNATAFINWNDTAATIQTRLRALPGLEEVVVTGSLASQTVNVEMNGVYGETPAVLTITNNTLATSGPVAITFIVTNDVEGESIADAITRTSTLVQYFGLVTNHCLAEIGQTDLLAAAAVIQALPMMGFFGSYTPADVAPSGMIDLIRTGSFTQTRCLYYQDSTDLGLNAILYAARYSGRLLSVVYTGNLTTITMNLKQLAGQEPDPNINNTNKNLALAAGADVYISIAGSPENISSGENQFVDNVQNQLWFAGAIQVALFNYLAQTSTKILQTEDGMTGLKGALRQVCLQAVNNGYLAPGTWNSSTTFGNLSDFYANISQFGFYIFSAPIGQQSAQDREDRKAPLIQVAAKLAGAIQSASVLVVINP